MWIKNVFLLFFGLCAGGIIAAGVYAFLAIIGVFVRMIGKTKTKKHIMLYENMIILGGVLGNIMELYKVRLIWLRRICIRLIVRMRNMK